MVCYPFPQSSVGAWRASRLINHRRKILIALGAGVLAAPPVSFAQGFPAKPLRLIVRAPPGAHLVDARKYPYKHLRAGVRLEPLGPAFEQTAS